MYDKLIYTAVKKGYAVSGQRNIWVKLEIGEKDCSHQLDWETLEPIKGTIHVYSITGSCKKAGSNRKEFGQINIGMSSDDVNDGLKNIFRLWNKFHLNDVKAGTKKQTEFLDSMGDLDYETACWVLRQNDLYNDRGYEYGHKWLVRQITPEEEQELIEAFS